MTKAFSSSASNGVGQHDLLRVDEDTVIPRLIHQTFMSKVLPAELEENVENIKRMNPGWLHVIYDDDDIKEFIKTNYGLGVLTSFERINPRYGAARADLFRYMLMYKCGGVYLDIKSTCTCPLDEVLQPDDKYVLSHWGNKPGELHAGFGNSHQEMAHIAGGEYQQWHIIAAPGHPFLRVVIEAVLNNIDQYRPWRHGTSAIGVLRLTGPIAYTLAIHPLLSMAPHRLVEDETILGLQYSVYKHTSHRAVYKTNYSVLTESVVRMNGTGRWLAVLYSLAKKGKRWTTTTFSAANNTGLR